MRGADVAASTAPVLRHLSRETAHTFPQTVLRLTLGRTSSRVNKLGWALFVLGALVLAGQLLKAVDPQDEGQFLTYPWLIAQGHVPYRDIWMSYPPATYLILVPFFKVGVAGMAAERGLGFLSRILYVLVVNRLLTGTWRRCSWIGVPLTFSLAFIASDIKPYPWLVALPLFVVGLALTRDRPMTSALVFLLAGTFRFEFGAGGLVALAALSTLERERRRSIMAAAAALSVTLMLFYLSLNLATDGYAFRDIFLDQVIAVQRGRFLSLASLPFGPLGLPVLLVLLAGPVLMILVGLRLRRPHVAATNFAVLALMPHFFQRVDTSHLFSMSALAIPWVVIGLATLARDADPFANYDEHDSRPAGDGTRGLGVIAVALGWIGLTVGAWCSVLVLAYTVYLSPLSPLSSTPPTQLPERVVSGQNTILAWDRAEAHDDRQVVRYVKQHATGRQKIFITPASSTSSYTRTDLYYVVGLQPSGGYLEVQPNVETQPAVRRRIEHDLLGGKWVVLVQGGPWFGPAANWQHVDDPLVRFIREHYHTVMQNFTYAILKRDDSSAR